MAKRLFGVTLMLLCVASAVSAGEDEEWLKKTRKALEDAFNAGDAKAAAFYAPDAMLLPPNVDFVQVLALAGIVAAVSGVMLSSLTTLAPTMGYDPMVKAFIICVIAGLGNVAGSCYAAFAQMIGADGIGICRMVPYWLLGLAILFPLCWLYGRFKHSRSPGSLWRFL